MYLVLDTIWKNIIPLTKVAKHKTMRQARMGLGDLASAEAKAQRRRTPPTSKCGPLRAWSQTSSSMPLW